MLLLSPSSSTSSTTTNNNHSGGHSSTPVDPNAPKPPLTGYQHYFKLRQSELRSQDASLKFGDIVKIVGNEWSKNIDKDTKNVSLPLNMKYHQNLFILFIYHFFCYRRNSFQRVYKTKNATKMN